MEPEIKASVSSSSGLEFSLHPLVLINISDHHTRNRVNNPDQKLTARVVGCLLGQQEGRAVDISNSFEVGEFPDEISELDFTFLHKKLEQYKQVFPKLDVVGWYATGTALGPKEMEVQRKIMKLNESPVVLILDTLPRQSVENDLPVTLHESELRVIDGAPSFIFVESSFSVATSEAERIGVDQVAKLLPSGNAAGSDQLTSHLSGLHNAATMLTTRVEKLQEVLVTMQEGQIPFDPGFVRQCAAFAARLPTADTSHEFAKNGAVETCDAMLSVLLAGMTTGIAQNAALVDKHNLAFERIGPASKRGGKMGSGIGLGL